MRLVNTSQRKLNEPLMFPLKYANELDAVDSTAKRGPIDLWRHRRNKRASHANHASVVSIRLLGIHTNSAHLATQQLHAGYQFSIRPETDVITNAI